MPFDTTYHIYSSDPNTHFRVTVPGGRDTSIYLQPGELPPHFDTSLLKAVDLIPLAERSAPSTIEPPNPHTPGTAFTLVFISVFVFIYIMARREAKDYRAEPLQKFLNNNFEEDVTARPVCLTYYGDELDLSNEQYAAVLTKHFPYYNSLDDNEKKLFLYRVDRFAKSKTFKIHDKQGFIEMPILVSAAAVQLTFGLKRFLLPNFEFIHIFPQEFMRVQPVICFLEGNVSGHRINLSWKHFLGGLKDPVDGKNVGLHEMAHALYYQTFVTEENVDPGFRDSFSGFNNYGNKVYNTEMIKENGLYSEYAMQNFQEFWAESVELFFEKPSEMDRQYPSLYAAMAGLLNQQPKERAV